MGRILWPWGIHPTVESDDLWLTKRKITKISTIQVCFSQKYVNVVYGGRLRPKKGLFDIIY